MSERVRLLGGMLNIRSVLGKGSIVEVELPHGGAGAAHRPGPSDYRSPSDARIALADVTR